MTGEPRFDVAVVGAGPAGACCALRLARGGASVVLLDRKAPPRYKACGGGLTARARRELETLVPLDGVIEDECRRAEMRLANAGRTFAVERPAPIVTMTQRSELDARIVETAREAGAELRVPLRIKGLERTAGGLLLRTDGEDLVARHVVAADGAVGSTASLAGWPALRVRVPALEAELRVDPAVLRRFAGTARFDFDRPRDGYAWVFPKAGHLSVGCLATRRGKGTLRSTFERYLAELEIGPVLGREDHGALIPAAPREAPLARDGVLLVGDAAGLVDPLTFEGLGYAVDSARLAATALIDGGGAPGAAERLYQASLEETILPELKRARLLARFTYGAPRLRNAAFRLRGQPLVEALCQVITGELGYGELGARAGHWWRLLRESSPGPGTGRSGRKAP